MIVKKIFFVLILLLGANTAIAIPTTDISIFDLKALLSNKDTKPFYLTYRAGYDNQPKFSNDGDTIYFTRAITANDKSQMDIMAYSFSDKSLSNISQSNDSSEYSATPYKDGLLTIIGVADTNGKQYLNQLKISDAAQKTFTTAIEPVGYHAWLNKTQAAVFVLGKVMTLQILDTENNNKPKILAENIGRCLQRISENKISYTIEEKGNHRIYILDGEHQSHDTAIVLPKGVQDYVWLNDNEVIFGKGAKLYRQGAYDASEIADLSDLGIKGISRLAINKGSNRLSVVYSR